MMFLSLFSSFFDSTNLSGDTLKPAPRSRKSSVILMSNIHNNFNAIQTVSQRNHKRIHAPFHGGGRQPPPTTAVSLLLWMIQPERHDRVMNSNVIHDVYNWMFLPHATTAEKVPYRTGDRSRGISIYLAGAIGMARAAMSSMNSIENFHWSTIPYEVTIGIQIHL
jgi:hypothetical protein